MIPSASPQAPTSTSASTAPTAGATSTSATNRNGSGKVVYLRRKLDSATAAAANILALQQQPSPPTTTTATTTATSSNPIVPALNTSALTGVNPAPVSSSPVSPSPLLPPNALTSQQLAQRIQLLKEEKERKEKEKREQEELYKKIIQEEEKQQQQQLEQQQQQSHNPPSPSRKAFLIKSNHAAGVASASTISPQRTAPLSLALPLAMGVNVVNTGSLDSHRSTGSINSARTQNQGSNEETSDSNNHNNSNISEQQDWASVASNLPIPAFCKPQRDAEGNLAAWEVVGAPSRYKSPVRNNKQKSEKQNEQQRQETEANTLPPPQFEYNYSFQPPPPHDPSLALAQRIVSSVRQNQQQQGNEAFNKKMSKIAPPRFQNKHIHHSKTWQHNPFLLARKQAQSKKINQLVKNQLLLDESEKIKAGLPSSTSRLVDDYLIIKGEDLFQLPREGDEDEREEMDEEEWYRQRLLEMDRSNAGGSLTTNSLDPSSSQDSSSYPRTSKKKKHLSKEMMQSWDSPVEGPSLVLSASRLFFPLAQGPVTTPIVMQPNANTDGNAEGNETSSSTSVGNHDHAHSHHLHLLHSDSAFSLVSSASSIPGHDDRVSRSLEIKNNGSTAVQFEWVVCEGALEEAANEEISKRGGEESERKQLIPSYPSLLSTSTTSSNGCFYASNPYGTLLPGESTAVIFTFVPPAPGNSQSNNGGMVVQRLRLDTVPRLKKNRALTQAQHFQRMYELEHGKEGNNDRARTNTTIEYDDVNSTPCLTLTGCLVPIDTGSVSRARFYSSLIESKNRQLTQFNLLKTELAIREPPPPESQWREIFYKANRDLRLFYYANKMQDWFNLSQEIIAIQKLALRRSLVWDFSASTLAKWIAQTPNRNSLALPAIKKKYQDLVGYCQVRPAPHPVRYQVAYGLLTAIAASIPRLSNLLQVETGISEPLEQEVRKANEEKRKKEEEIARAKLPFHLRNNNNNTNFNLSSLTPEQRKLREEENARAQALLQAQAADDAVKRAERAELVSVYNTKLHAEIKSQLCNALNYFDFLAAPQNTNLDPQAAMNEEENNEKNAREAASANTTASATASAVTSPSSSSSSSSSTSLLNIDVSNLRLLNLPPTQILNADGTITILPPSALAGGSGSGSGPLSLAINVNASSPPSAKGEKDGEKEKKGGNSSSTKKDKNDTKSNSKRGASTSDSSSHDNGIDSLSRPVTPRYPSYFPLLQLTPSESQQRSHVYNHPHLYSALEIERIRSLSLKAFLEWENQRRARQDRMLRSKIVYHGNGYSTPDTGIHIPTAAELKLAEERERMARYGQSISKELKEAEERKKRDMHPMSILSQRHILLSASSSIFSLAFTRDRGVWGWVVTDPPEVDEAPVLDAVKTSKRGGAAAAAANISGSPALNPTTGNSKKEALVMTGKTKIQENRRAILGLLALPAFNPTLLPNNNANTNPTGKDGKNSSLSVDKNKSASGSKSPRGSSKNAAAAAAAAGATTTTPATNSANPAGSPGLSKKTLASTVSRPDSGSSTSRSDALVPASNSLLPAIPTVLTPLAALSTSPLPPSVSAPAALVAGNNNNNNNNNSAPAVPLLPLLSPSRPVYLPEFQGLDITCLSLGIHTAFFSTSLGSLYAWEHATRKMHVLNQRQWPGEKEEKTQRYTLQGIQEAKEKGISLTEKQQPPSDVNSLETGRNDSSNTNNLTLNSTRKSSITATTASPAAGPLSSSSSGSDKKRKAGGNSGSGSNASTGKGKNNAAGSEPEVMSIDSSSYEAEQERLARLTRDADFTVANKQVVSVVVGGSGTLCSSVHYVQTGYDFEFVLVLTADGCVYSSLVSPPQSYLNSPALPTIESMKGSNAGAAAAAAAKAAAKEKESSIAMLGIGEKTKDAIKSEKEMAKQQAAAEKNNSANTDKPSTSSGRETAGSSDGGVSAYQTPLVHFELVSTLHPANLSVNPAHAVAITQHQATQQQTQAQGQGSNTGSHSSSLSSFPSFSSSSNAYNDAVRVISLSAGYGHCLALCSDGSVYSWGIEGPQLGLGAGTGAANDKEAKENRRSRFIPTLITALQGLTVPIPAPQSPSSSPSPTPQLSISIDSGSGSTNSNNPLASPSSKKGNRPGSGPKETPSSARGNRGSISLKKGPGGVSDSLLPSSSSSSTDTPWIETMPGPADPVVAVSCGAFHSLALTKSGCVYAWGRNQEGQLGLGDNKERDAPTVVTNLSPGQNPALLMQALEKIKNPPANNSNNKDDKNKAAARTNPYAAAQSTATSASAASAVNPSNASATANTPPPPPPLSPLLRVTAIQAAGAHSIVLASPVPEALELLQQQQQQQGTGEGDEDALTSAFLRSNNSNNLAESIPQLQALGFGSNSSGALGLGHTQDSWLPIVIPFYTNNNVMQLQARADATQAVVVREKKPTGLTLTVDEDDVPDQVILH